MSLTAGSRLGPYEILMPIGAGGMGAVYLALDTRLGRRVAIKLLVGDATDETGARRLLKEAQAAAALDHPNICAIHEIGDAGGRPFIVMPYIEGETLSARLARQPPSDIAAALDIAVQIADALADAHAHGIVHRDVKPLNVMLTPRGQVKVLDFGLARAVAAPAAGREVPTKSATSATGMVSGTLPYMSPEQMRGEPVDARTDVFSFGVLLYELVTGRRPFAGDSDADMITSILSAPPPPVARYAPDAPFELQRIIAKCLEKDRERRYQTMRDVEIDIENARGAYRERETASGLTASEAARKGGRSILSRRPLWFAVALALTAVAVTAPWWLPWTRGRNSGIRSLAVLPLRTLGPESDHHLGVGIADTLISKIGQVGTLVVRPTSAVRRYATEETDSLEAARRLRVDAVLEGTIQRAGDRLRVNANLLRVSDGASLWSDSFDVRLTDIFELQDRISQQVAAQLRLKLSGPQQAGLVKRYTSSSVAYEYYVKGMYSQDRGRGRATSNDAEALRTAIAMFKRAIEVDPTYALAHTQLAYCYVWMALFIDEDNPVWLNLANRSLQEAERLDPRLAEVHLVRAQLYWSRHEGWNMTEAIREMRLAQAIDATSDPAELGVLYAHVGLEDLSIRQLQRAIESDPTSEIPHSRLAESYELFCRPDDAIAVHERFYRRPGPTLALLWKNRLDEARHLIEDDLARSSANMRALSMRARLLAIRGEYAAAEAMIAPLVERGKHNRGYHHATYNVAAIYALQGKAAEALQWLEKTAETGMPDYTLFARDPHLNRIRSDPHIIRFLADAKKQWERFRQMWE